MNLESEFLKCRIIDFLLASDSGIIIGNEVMYGSCRKVVDLLAIRDNQLIAIEIKSKADTTTRLPDQIEEYTKIFDKVIVFSSPEKVERILAILPASVGLYSIDKSSISIIKRPSLLRGQKKNEMLASMNAQYLKKCFELSSNINSDEVRKTLRRKSRKLIHETLCVYYQNKIRTKFQMFLQDRGELTNVDDIPTLSKSNEILLR